LTDKSSAVQAAPNGSRISGTVAAVESLDDSVLITVRVDSAESVGTLANFAHRYVGRTLKMQSALQAQCIRPGDRIVARVSFEGNDSGGGFVSLASQLCKL
jgi:hypothetical protein